MSTISEIYTQAFINTIKEQFGDLNDDQARLIAIFLIVQSFIGFSKNVVNSKECK